MGETTVVIATRDRVDELVRTLTHLKELSVPVIVVDNGSSDGTVARVWQEFPWVRTLVLEHNVGASARNHGVRLALAKRGVGDRDARAALGAAVLRLPAVAKQRHRLPAAVERQVEMLTQKVFR